MNSGVVYTKDKDGHSSFKLVLTNDELVSSKQYYSLLPYKQQALDSDSAESNCQVFQFKTLPRMVKIPAQLKDNTSKKVSPIFIQGLSFPEENQEKFYVQCTNGKEQFTVDPSSIRFKQNLF